MATTNYIDNSLPTIGAAWLNDVDAAVYEGLLGATTPAAIITALSLSPTNTPTFAGVVLPALGLVDGRDVSVDGAKLDTISAGAGPASNSFVNIAVATQGTVIATSPTDTLTLVAGANVTITTVPGTDTITLDVPGAAFAQLTGAAFTGPITVSGNAVRDNGNIFHGRVNADGTVNRLPAGWTSSNPSVGVYLVTHNLGTANYSLVPQVRVNSASPDWTCAIDSTGTLSFTVQIALSGVVANAPFHFILMLD